MATRSRIAVKQQDGSVKSIYCHFDGYPLYNGATLLDYYPREKANALMEVGNIRQLGVPPNYHLYDQEGIHYKTFELFLEDLGHEGEEYGYILMEDDQWYCIPVVGDDLGEMQLVTEILSESGV